MNNKMSSKKNSFPKIIPELTNEQKLIKDDFMEHWLKILRKKYTIVDNFNHKVVLKSRPKNFLKTLEIGAGIGEHLNYEKLNNEQNHVHHFGSKNRDSRHFQWSIYTVFHEESDFQVRNEQFQRLEVKN